MLSIVFVVFIYAAAFTYFMDILAIGTAFFLVFAEVIVFSILVVIIEKNVINLLDEQCDPDKMIKSFGKFKFLFLRRKMNDYLKINKSVGHHCAGRYDEALSLLSDVYITEKSGRAVRITYYLLLFACYINKNDMEEARVVYEKHILELRKYALAPRTAIALDSSVSLYLYLLNKTSETTKYYLEQLNYYYKMLPPKKWKRFKLSNIYNRALAELDLGLTEEAVKKLKIVADNANKLWIAADSANRLREMGRL